MTTSNNYDESLFNLLTVELNTSGKLHKIGSDLDKNDHNTDHSVNSQVFSSEWLKDPVVNAIHEAKLLGWTLYELTSRLKIAEAQKPVLFSGKCKWMSSNWGARLNRIISIYYDHLNDVNISGTFYDLSERADLKYLVDESSTDLDDEISFLSVFSSQLNQDRTGTDVNKQDKMLAHSTYVNPEVLQRFSLYKMIQRALNGLLLLYTCPVVLEAENKMEARNRFVEAVLKAHSKYTPAWESNERAVLDEVISITTKNAVLLLDTWSSLIREQYYTYGKIKFDDVELVAYQAGRGLASISWKLSTKLSQLEAVREKFASISTPFDPNTANTASLRKKYSWEMTQLKIVTNYLGAIFETGEDCDPEIKVKINPIRQMLKEVAEAPTEITVGQPSLKALLAKLNDLKDQIDTLLKDAERLIWRICFCKREIIKIQHQYSGLSSALDDAYYRVFPDPNRVKSLMLFEPNTNLPSKAIQALNSSLDYWQRVVSLIYEKDPKPLETYADTVSLDSRPPFLTKKMPVGSGKVTLHFSSDEDKEVFYLLRTSLIQQSDVWQNMTSCHMHLSAFTNEGVTKKIMSDFTEDFEKAAKKMIGTSLTKLWMLAGWALGSFGLVLVIYEVLSLIVPSLGDAQKLATVALTAVAGLIGGHISSKTGKHTVSSLALSGHVTATLSSSGEALSKVFHEGYAQIKSEFAWLNYNISVAFPLVEFFSLSQIKMEIKHNYRLKTMWFDERTQLDTKIICIKDGYMFLRYIIWSDEEHVEEVKQLARSAFGPIGALIGSQLRSD